MEGSATARAWLLWSTQRTVRLGLPVAASLGISAVLYVLFYAGQWPGEGEWLTLYLWQSPPTPSAMAEQALLVRSAYRYELNNVLWSLAHEWRISILLPLIAALPVFQGTKSGVALLLIGLAIPGLIGGHAGDRLNLNPGALGSFQSTAYFVAPFAFGAALHRLKVQDIRLTISQNVAALFALAGLASMNSDLGDCLASALLICIALQPGMFKRALGTPALQWLGSVSFSLYLVHELVLAPLHHALHGQIPATALFALSCVGALAASYVFFLLIDAPSHDLARKVGRVGRQRLTDKTVQLQQS